MINNKKKYSIIGLIGIIIIFTILSLSQCSKTGFCGWSKNDYCENNSDCIRGGCSGEVCGSASGPIFGTTCEWLECYDWRKYNLGCGCVDNKCQWSK